MLTVQSAWTCRGCGDLQTLALLDAYTMARATGGWTCPSCGHVAVVPDTMLTMLAKQVLAQEAGNEHAVIAAANAHLTGIEVRAGSVEYMLQAEPLPPKGSDHG